MISERIIFVSRGITVFQCVISVCGRFVEVETLNIRIAPVALQRTKHDHIFSTELQELCVHREKQQATKLLLIIINEMLIHLSAHNTAYHYTVRFQELMRVSAA